MSEFAGKRPLFCYWPVTECCVRIVHHVGGKCGRDRQTDEHARSGPYMASFPKTPDSRALILGVVGCPGGTLPTLSAVWSHHRVAHPRLLTRAKISDAALEAKASDLLVSVRSESVAVLLWYHRSGCDVRRHKRGLCRTH